MRGFDRTRLASSLAIASTLVLTSACAGPSATATGTQTRLRWVECAGALDAAGRLPGRVQCGEVDVPERHDVPGGRTLTLSLLVLRARQPDVDSVPVFALTGGPGEPATTLASAVSRAWDPVRERRDIVLVDQRGTGGLQALRCERPIAEDPAAAFGQVFDPAAVARCRASLARHADLGAYTTAASVDDLEIVRVNLGVNRLLLWGGSYGTRLALAYTRRHSDRVVLAVLDGVAPPDISATAGYARGLQQALDRTVSRCHATPACRTSFPALDRDVQTMAARLRASPAATTVRLPSGDARPVTMSLGDALYAIRGVLYESTGSEQLPSMLHAAAQGNLQPLAQRYWARSVRLQRSVATGAHLSLLCGEDVPAIDPEVDARLNQATAGTLLGRYLVDDYRRACTAWGLPPGSQLLPRSKVFTHTVTGLLLSGRFDPSTPPEYGDWAAMEFATARHDVVDTAGHGVSFGCARETVARALTQGSFEGVPVACRR